MRSSRGERTDALLAFLLAALAAQRLAELATSRRHERALVSRGGRVVAGDWHAALVAVHVLFFAAAAAEGALSPWAGRHVLTWPLLALFLAGQVLRLAARRALGARWTTRVVVLPGAPPVTAGPYRWLRHPNYAGVAVELAALPLAFGLWATALAVGALNAAVLLAGRIPVEERALAGSYPTAEAPGAAPEPRP